MTEFHSDLIGTRVKIYKSDGDSELIGQIGRVRAIYVDCDDNITFLLQADAGNFIDAAAVDCTVKLSEPA